MVAGCDRCRSDYIRCCAPHRTRLTKLTRRHMRNRYLTLGWILVVGAVSILIGKAVAQDPSTPEERAQWVEITHKLESSPLDDSVNKQGEAAFKRFSDVHDVHVLLCPALLSEFNGMKYAYAHTITRQYMLDQRCVPDRESRQSRRYEG